MLVSNKFPVPQLLQYFPNSIVTEVYDYYKVTPHKEICFFVRVRQQENEPGIYISTRVDYINYLTNRLKSFKRVHNFQEESLSFLSIDRYSKHFYNDLEVISDFIQSLKKR